MSDLFTRQETLKGINHDLSDSRAFSYGFLFDRVPQFIIDSNVTQGSIRHDLDTTNLRHIKHISHAHCVIVKSFKKQDFCFTRNVILVLANQKIATGIASKFATIVGTLISFGANNAFDSARFNHFCSFRSAPKLVSVGTVNTNVGTVSIDKGVFLD